MSYETEQLFLPQLPILETKKFVEKMEEEQWSLPLPYEERDTPENMQKKADRLLGRWVSFIHTAYSGYMITKRYEEQGLLSGDLYKLQMFTYFNKVSESLVGDDMLDYMRSARRGFAVLLSNKALENLSYVNPDSVYQEEEILFRESLQRDLKENFGERDVYNARVLINEMDEQCGPSPFSEHFLEKSYR